ncbi:MAG: helix-turn-helix transcriptional regulator [Bacteroidales bacterium]|nr:helix-turn-helix transcriptional regulator [Bacteroidales bacterium]
MKVQLDISNLESIAIEDDAIYVKDDFAIIRDTVGLKSRIPSSGLSDLLYIPMGRILLVQSGSVSLRLNMQPCEVGSHQALVIPENYYMEIVALSDDYNARIVSFSDIATPFMQWGRVLLEAADEMRMLQYVELLWSVAHAGNCSKQVLNDILKAMLTDLYGLSSRGANTSLTNNMNAAEQLMQRFFNLMSQSDGTVRSVSAYASRLCVTPNHLSAVVKQQSGQTVMQLLNAHTVLQAKVLLRHTHQPIYEVADLLGFESSASFCRFFKRETGVAPGSLRS